MPFGPVCMSIRTLKINFIAMGGVCWEQHYKPHIIWCTTLSIIEMVGGDFLDPLCLKFI